MKQSSCWLRALWSSLLAAAVVLPSHAAKTTAADLFEDSRVTQIELEVSTDDLARIRTQKLSGLKEREKINVTVREGGRAYREVSMHLKGSIGSFRPIDDKPGLTLDFDDADKDQRFHGLKKLSLNNSVQDPIYMSERLSRELFRQSGIPCTRAGFATVKLNGRDLGVYLLMEAYDRQFLKQHFQDASGNLYDIALGEELDVRGKQPVNSGDNPTDQSDLKELVAAVTEPDLGMRMDKLSKILDLDRFVKHLALDVMLHNWDGYGWGQNNYRIFHDRASRRLVFMPHGVDQTFQKADVTITPRMYGAAAHAFLAIPQARQRYLEEMRVLLERVFVARDMTNRVQKLAQTLRPEIAARGAEGAAEFDKGVANYCDQIGRRVESVKSQLAGLENPARFDDSGSLHVTDFKQSTEFGKPRIERLPGGLLRIAAGDGAAIASWSKKIWVPQGKYRFEGRVQANGVTLQPGDRFGGVGLRVGGRRFPQASPGSKEWAALSYDFEVTDAMFEVELICELRAAKGEAAFDEASLRIVHR